MLIPTREDGRQLPEALGQGGEGVTDAPGGAVARPDGVGDRAQLQHGRAVRGGLPVRIKWVIKNGELFDAETLDQEWPVHKPLPPFFWKERRPSTTTQ